MSHTQSNLKTSQQAFCTVSQGLERGHHCQCGSYNIGLSKPEEGLQGVKLRAVRQSLKERSPEIQMYTKACMPDCTTQIGGSYSARLPTCRSPPLLAASFRLFAVDSSRPCLPSFPCTGDRVWGSVDLARGLRVYEAASPGQLRNRNACHLSVSWPVKHPVSQSVGQPGSQPLRPAEHSNNLTEHSNNLIPITIHV